MPSPFPGMNPYLEQDDAWHDFHQRFAPLVAELVGAQIGPDYIVKVESHIYIHDLTEDEDDVERDSYVEIRDRRGRHLITVIELLSPSNKQPGADRDQYVAKRAQLFSSSA